MSDVLKREEKQPVKIQSRIGMTVDLTGKLATFGTRLDVTGFLTTEDAEQFAHQLAEVLNEVGLRLQRPA